ncbi:hypothetical protein [Streptomyces venezuelae]|uniref:hypothetical protein n=1 Tax=Streptomyces venezuelae TaxID=54571 RepID=UPI00364C594B
MSSRIHRSSGAFAATEAGTGRDSSRQSAPTASVATPRLRSARTTKNAEIEVAPSAIGRVSTEPAGAAPYWISRADRPGSSKNSGSLPNSYVPSPEDGSNGLVRAGHPGIVALRANCVTLTARW